MSVEYVFFTSIGAAAVSGLLGVPLVPRGPGLADGYLGGHYLWVLAARDTSRSYSTRHWGVPLGTQVCVQLLKDAPEATREVVERVASLFLAHDGDVVLERADEGVVFMRLGRRLRLNSNSSWWRSGVPAGFPRDHEWATIPEP